MIIVTIILAIIAALLLGLSHRLWLRVSTLETYLASEKTDHANTRRRMEEAVGATERANQQRREANMLADHAIFERDEAVRKLQLLQDAHQTMVKVVESLDASLGLSRRRLLRMYVIVDAVKSAARALKAIEEAPRRPGEADRGIARATGGLINAAMQLIEGEPAATSAQIAKDQRDSADEVMGGER